jgi:hypothetical protein
MAKKPKANKPLRILQMDRRQPTNKDRSNDADQSGADRHARERRSGEGSQSALASLKNIERDRRRSSPDGDGSSDN